MADLISDEQWSEFQRDGFFRLGCVMQDGELSDLSTRMDDIMLGRAPLDYDRIAMQLDSDPERGGMPGPQSKGHKGATLAYRKIQDLEFDPLFLAFLQKPIFQRICERAYGKRVSIACVRRRSLASGRCLARIVHKQPPMNTDERVFAAFDIYTEIRSRKDVTIRVYPRLSVVS